MSDYYNSWKSPKSVKSKFWIYSEAERKATKSAAEKHQKEERALKRLAQTDEEWVICLIFEIISDVPIISEKQNVRRTTNTKATKL